MRANEYIPEERIPMITDLLTECLPSPAGSDRIRSK